MFWRLLHRSFWQNQRRTEVALAALTLAATLSATLLNLYFDAQAKVSADFRRYGANLLVTPAASGMVPGQRVLLDEGLAQAITAAPAVSQVWPYLYAVARVEGESVVLAGTRLSQAAELRAAAELSGSWVEDERDETRCLVGSEVARRFGLGPASVVEVEYGGRRRRLEVAGIVRTGAQEDNQIIADLSLAQELTRAPGKASVLLVRAEGQPEELEALARALIARFPGIVARPLREITESEVRVLRRIRDMLWGSTALVLLLTTLCVLTTMTALASERQREIGLIKALGGSERQIGWLFLAEAALGALLAGIAGAGLGLALSGWLGRQIFSSPVEIRWMTLPAAVAISLAVALFGTSLALRGVRGVEPAVSLRAQ